MIIDEKHWHDISNEEWREYIYPNGEVIHVSKPQKLNIQKSSMGGHSHRIISGSDSTTGNYIAPGWLAIRWNAPDGGFKF